MDRRALACCGVWRVRCTVLEGRGGRLEVEARQILCVHCFRFLAEYGGACAAHVGFQRSCGVCVPCVSETDWCGAVAGVWELFTAPE